MTGKRQNIWLRLFGRRPGCDWVTDRLLPYLKVDPKLSDREYAAIDAHLASCPTCAEEYKALSDGSEVLDEILYPDESLPYIDCNAMAARITANLDADQAAPHAPQILEFKPVGRQTTNRVRRLRPAAAGLAAAAIFIVAVPVLAYVGQQVWQQVCQTLNNPADTQLASPNVSVPSEPTDPSDAPASPGTATATPTDDRCSLSLSDTDLFTAVDKETQQRAIRAEIEATLPHTDAEYEAWARKEYPHVMALYDILTGKGLPHKDESIDRETTQKRFAALVPNNLPEDVRAYLLEMANRAAQSNHPLWDGRPVNIPDWAQRLYADTPEPERPTAWRALLIYSGEIFKLDWPRTIQEPNVIPNLDGLHNAAVVAGRATTPDATFTTFAHQHMPNEYLDTLAESIPLAYRVLSYLASISHIIGTKDFNALGNDAVATHAALRNTHDSECAVHTRVHALSELFDSREETFRNHRE